MMSTEEKNCENCLNHGLKIGLTKDHKKSCGFIDCKCEKCSNVKNNEDNEKIILRKLNQRNDLNKKLVSKSLQTEFPPRDPLEAVKCFAEQLSKSDISENNLRTCVLYALLKNNDFSIEETKRKLLEARTAITESLVLPLKKFNSNHSTSFQNEEYSVPQKRFCSESNRSTARKSFPKLKNTPNFSNINPTKGIRVSTSSPTLSNATNSLVQTSERTSDSKSPSSVASNIIINSFKNIAPKPIVSIPNQSNITPSISSVVTENDGKTSETMSLISNSSLNSNVATTYIVPLMPIMNLQSGMTPTFIQIPYPFQTQTPEVSNTSPQVKSSLPKTTSTSSGPTILRGVNKTVPKNVIRVSPSKTNINSVNTANECALKGIKINSITKVPTNSFTTNSMTNFPTAQKPEIRTYSRVLPNNDKTKQNDLNIDSSNANKLCAKIITSEAALAALSTISSISSSSDAQNQNMSSNRENDNEIEEEYILPDELSSSADESSDNAVNTYVINTIEKPLTANKTQNDEQSMPSCDQISLMPNFTGLPVQSSIISPNVSQESPKAALSFIQQKKIKDRSDYISQVITGIKNKQIPNNKTHINFIRQNKDKNIVQITID